MSNNNDAWIAPFIIYGTIALAVGSVVVGVLGFVFELFGAVAIIALPIIGFVLPIYFIFVVKRDESNSFLKWFIIVDLVVLLFATWLCGETILFVYNDPDKSLKAIAILAIFVFGILSLPSIIYHFYRKSGFYKRSNFTSNERVEPVGFAEFEEESSFHSEDSDFDFDSSRFSTKEKSQEYELHKKRSFDSNLTPQEKLLSYKFCFDADNGDIDGIKRLT